MEIENLNLFVMDSTTYKELNNRVSALEIALSQPTARREPLIIELESLKCSLRELYDQNPELEVLSGIIDQLGIEGIRREESIQTEDVKTNSQDGTQLPKEDTADLHETQLQTKDITDLDETEGKTVEKLTKPLMDTSNLSLQSKKQLVLMKTTLIRQAYDNIEELAAFDIPQIVNYMANSQDKTHNFNKDRKKLAMIEPRAEAIAARFHEVVVRNMLLAERYVDTIVKENAFWLETQQRLRELERKRESKY